VQPSCLRKSLHERLARGTTYAKSRRKRHFANLAVVWQLPLLFVCENNQWQAFVQRDETMPMDDVADWVRGHGLAEVRVVDGNAVEAVHEAAKALADAIRTDGRHRLLELTTWRQRGHFEPDDCAYVDAAEAAAWQDRDPLRLQAERLRAEGLLNEAGLAAMRSLVDAEFDAALAGAQAAGCSRVRGPPCASISIRQRRTESVCADEFQSEKRHEKVLAASSTRKKIEHIFAGGSISSQLYPEPQWPPDRIGRCPTQPYGPIRQPAIRRKRGMNSFTLETPMRTNSVLSACLLAAGLTFGGLVVPTVATAATVWVRTAPPPPREEAVPAPRRGYVWVPGYWDWNGRRHMWHGGVWMKERRGYVYTQPAWVEHEDRWEFRRGAWARGDADHDGVPNGVDRRPNNPNRN